MNYDCIFLQHVTEMFIFLHALFGVVYKQDMNNVKSCKICHLPVFMRSQEQSAPFLSQAVNLNLLKSVEDMVSCDQEGHPHSP